MLSLTMMNKGYNSSEMKKCDGIELIASVDGMNLKLIAIAAAVVVVGVIVMIVGRTVLSRKRKNNCSAENFII